MVAETATEAFKKAMIKPPSTVSIVTWNVNSIKARLEEVVSYLREHPLDILCLQELKTIDEAFPYEAFAELHYNVLVHGQKTYNGVAICSKFPLELVTKSLDGNDDDEQARYIEAVVSLPHHALRVASVYVPNGQEVGSDKFHYKLKFLKRLTHHIETLLSYEEAVIIAGDYNIAPYPIDVFDPKSLKDTVCFHPDEQKYFRQWLGMGYYDAFRIHHADKQQFSWWDYRGSSFEYNKGMRIDHLLLSPEAVQCLKECKIDATPRARLKASDHAPVWSIFQFM